MIPVNFTLKFEYMSFKWRKEEDQLLQITSDQILVRIPPQSEISLSIGFRFRVGPYSPRRAGSQQRLKRNNHIKQPFFFPCPPHLPLNFQFCLYFSEILRKIYFKTSGCLTHWPISCDFHPSGKQWALFKSIQSVSCEPACRQSSFVAGQIARPTVFSAHLPCSASLL